MPSEIATLKQILRGTLLADPTVSGLVSSRVYGVHLQSADAATVLTDGPLVVFEMLAGFAAWHGSVMRQTVEIYAYSKRSSDEATQVYDAAFNAIQHSRVSVDGVVMRALSREVQRPLDGWNNDLRAWFVRGRWSMSAVSGGVP